MAATIQMSTMLDRAQPATAKAIRSARTAASILRRFGCQKDATSFCCARRALRNGKMTVNKPSALATEPAKKEIADAKDL